MLGVDAATGERHGLAGVPDATVGAPLVDRAVPAAALSYGTFWPFTRALHVVRFVVALKSLQLPIVAGGRLLTQPSVALESVGADNFATLLNVYRDYDVFARLPGWAKFQPDTGVSVTNQYTFDATETLLRVAEVKRGDGTKVVVGASLTLIKYYDTATDAWVQIGSGFSSSGLPWQAVVMAGYVIFNNAVNLPVWWQVGDAAVTPLHELREAGVASVGRIASYNGFLFVGDVVEIKALLLPSWMNGYSNYTTVGTGAEVADFAVAATNRRGYAVTTGAATIVATLPTTLGLSDRFWFARLIKSDAGAGSVVTVPVIESNPVILTTVNDIALVMWDGTQWASVTFPGGVIPATDPYGITPTNIRQYVPDEQAWSELGDPINWAPLVSTIQASASVTVILPFRPFNWTARETRVAVINGGPDGGTLGGQSGYPTGILLTAIGAFSAATGGVSVTLEVTTDVALTYPRRMDVTRWADVSTFVGKQRMGNGSKIVCMLELNGVLVDYQADGIFITRWTAQATAPFALRQKYSGTAVPLFGDCVGAVRNSYHLYPSVEGSFVRFDGLTDPVIHEMCEGARDLFFDGLLPTDRCWAVENPTLQSIWFVRPTKVMAYRYRKDSEGVSEIDAVINAACFVRKPGGTVDWFVLGIGRFVYQWGLVGSTTSTWLRDGVAVTAKITSGLNAFRDQLHEKTLHTFTPILSSTSPDVALTVQIRGTYNPSGTLTDLLVPIESLPGPAGENLVACFFQQNYYQDEIVLTDVRDIDFRLSARLFQFAVVGGMAVTRSGVN